MASYSPVSLASASAARLRNAAMCNFRRSAIGATIKYVRQKLLKTLGLQQTLLDVLRDQIVELRKSSSPVFLASMKIKDRRMRPEQAMPG